MKEKEPPNTALQKAVDQIAAKVAPGMRTRSGPIAASSGPSTNDRNTMRQWVIRLGVAAGIEKSLEDIDDPMMGLALAIGEIGQKRQNDDATRAALYSELADSRARMAHLQYQVETSKRSKTETLHYANTLLEAINEAIDFIPERHHNKPPPSLRISDDRDYLDGLRTLASELKRFNDLLEKNSIDTDAASKSAVDFNRHFSVFLANFVPLMGKGTAGLLIAAGAGLLMHAGIPEATVGSLWAFSRSAR